MLRLYEAAYAFCNYGLNLGLCLGAERKVSAFGQVAEAASGGVLLKPLQVWQAAYA